jgi:Zn-finger protein
MPSSVVRQLPPGSDKALDTGCLCPVLDNAHGRGAQGTNGKLFWICVDCPLHGNKEVRIEEKETSQYEGTQTDTEREDRKTSPEDC